MNPMHIGFLFNHHGGHQVAHALPVALQLRRQNRHAEVSVLVSEGSEREVRRLVEAGLDSFIKAHILRQGGSRLAGQQVRCGIEDWAVVQKRENGEVLWIERNRDAIRIERRGYLDVAGGGTLLKQVHAVFSAKLSDVVEVSDDAARHCILRTLEECPQPIADLGVFTVEGGQVEAAQCLRLPRK